jgi:hypothetical protein
MASSGKLSCVALVRTDVWEELSASVIWVTRIGELGTTLAVTSNRRTLRRNTISDVFEDVMSCDSSKNKHFQGMYRLHHQGDKNCRVFLLLVTANIVSSSLILVTLMMLVIRSSETSVLTRATRRRVPEDNILNIIVPLYKLF